MSDPIKNIATFDVSRKLSDAIRDVKNADADREDVVVEMRDAERMRLEMLANELAPVIAEVPVDIDIFDFAVSSGLKPRFWIDAVSHVSMGRDKRAYRFVKDTRNGRVILAESTDPKPIADQVTRYIAERIVERERLIEGGAPASYQTGGGWNTPLQTASQAEIPHSETKVQSSGLKSFLSSLMIFLLGGLFAIAVLSSYVWDRLAGQ